MTSLSLNEADEAAWAPSRMDGGRKGGGLAGAEEGAWSYAALCDKVARAFLSGCERLRGPAPHPTVGPYSRPAAADNEPYPSLPLATMDRLFLFLRQKPYTASWFAGIHTRSWCLHELRLASGFRVFLPLPSAQPADAPQ